MGGVHPTAPVLTKSNCSLVNMEFAQDCLQWVQFVCDALSETREVINRATAMRNTEWWTFICALEQLVRFLLRKIRALVAVWRSSSLLVSVGGRRGRGARRMTSQTKSERVALGCGLLECKVRPNRSPPLHSQSPKRKQIRQCGSVADDSYGRLVRSTPTKKTTDPII